MIRNLSRIGLAIALLVIVPSAALAEHGVPSDTTLAAMGLSDMRLMSDEEGLAVRGQGFVLSAGLSWAYVGKLDFDPVKLPQAASFDLQVSYGEYLASSMHGSHADRLEIDGEVVTQTPDFGWAFEGDINYVRVSAGGFAAGKAF